MSDHLKAKAARLGTGRGRLARVALADVGDLDALAGGGPDGGSAEATLWRLDVARGLV